MSAKRVMFNAWFVCISLAALLATPAVLRAQVDESYSVTYSPYAAHRSVHTQLGPTGARAWLRGYHLVVSAIQHESPAFGTLELGDVIIGAAGTMFGQDADPRITLGNAITAAEAQGKPLELTLLRDGAQRVIGVKLQPMPPFSKTWPANCPKSEQILLDACEALAALQVPGGTIVTSGNFGTINGGLLFLASGRPEFLDNARRAAHDIADNEYGFYQSLNNWQMGYGGIFLAEYYLATGDDTVLPGLQRMCDVIVGGMMLSGTWGHRSPSGGYGGLNVTGLPCALTLVLAKECGLKIDEEALDHTLDFFARYAGTGTIPYGDHMPYRNLDDNGKNSTAAVLMHLAGRQEEARAFAASVAESYWQRELGHTGGYFSIHWGPLAARLAGEEKLRQFLDYQRWYHELSRQWTGHITMLPYKEAMTRFDAQTYVGAGGPFTTGGLGLLYAMQKNNLRITGAPPSVFSAKLKGPIAELRDLYLARDWQAFDEMLAESFNERVPAAANPAVSQLRAARERAKAAIDHDLMRMDSYLISGGPYEASVLLESLRTTYGQDADPRFAAYDEKLAGQTWLINEGAAFYEAWMPARNQAVKTWIPQGASLAEQLRNTKVRHLPVWEPLSPTSDQTPQAWRTRPDSLAEGLPDDWYAVDFDDSAWPVTEGIKTGGDNLAARRTFDIDDLEGQKLRVRVRTVRPTRTRVYLNGKLIADLERGQRSSYAAIELKPEVFGLLKNEGNVLAVTAEATTSSDRNKLDVGLEINRYGVHPQHLPIDYAQTHDTADLPDDTNTELLVTMSMDRYRDKLRERYDAKTVDALITNLGDIIPYYRTLAVNALVGKGPAGVEAALRLRDAGDWPTRSAVLEVVAEAAQSEDHDFGGLTKAQLPWVTQRLKDEHYWVRFRACRALQAMGKDAAAAAPKLAEAAGDSHEWVRTAAMSALKAVEPDDALAIAATKRAMDRTNSSFRILRHARHLLENHEADDAQRLAILVAILRQPPEGGGGAALKPIMDQAVELDPQGEMVIPVLIDAAADKTGLSRHRGNPFGHAIDILGHYGPKAADALPTLRRILADDTKPMKHHHDAARAAIEAITGQPEPGSESADTAAVEANS